MVSTQPTSDAQIPPQATDRVLSTLEADGSRRWLYPKLARGRLWNARRLVAYGLIAIYALAPYVKINGQPLVLIDVVRRQLHIFGVTFLPTDTTLLALLVLIVGLSIFLATAVLGRVWCGWACPQTVYLEFVFRPIERLFTGTAGRGGKPRNVAAWRIIAMYAAFLVIAVHLANTLLAYFVGADAVNRYIWSSTPLQHPGAFAVVAITTAWIVWDFAYWREQMCMIGCPYGRMQSVLLDRSSLIVSYDVRRGEPRGKTSKRAAKKQRCTDCSNCTNCGGEIDRPIGHALSLPTLTLPTTRGDCIDCTMCVQVCPTGIDIRNGLQLECINCTQCTDACNAVMDKVGKPRGLIGYSSQAIRAGDTRRRVRPRVIVYPALIALLGSLFLYLLITRPAFDLTVLRNPGRPFNVLSDGRIENTLRLKLVNRAQSDHTYAVDIVGDDSVIVSTDSAASLSPLATSLSTVRVSLSPDRFQADHVDVRLRVRSDLGETQERYVRLLGPIRSSKGK